MANRGCFKHNRLEQNRKARRNQPAAHFLYDFSKRVYRLSHKFQHCDVHGVNYSLKRQLNRVCLRAGLPLYGRVASLYLPAWYFLLFVSQTWCHSLRCGLRWRGQSVWPAALPWSGRRVFSVGLNIWSDSVNTGREKVRGQRPFTPDWRWQHSPQVRINAQ